MNLLLFLSPAAGFLFAAADSDKDFDSDFSLYSQPLRFKPEPFSETFYIITNVGYYFKLNLF